VPGFMFAMNRFGGLGTSRNASNGDIDTVVVGQILLQEAFDELLKEG
jgi:hypothetical protein